MTEEVKIRSAHFARCCIALTIMVLSTWMTNVFLYPQYNGIIPVARDVTSLVSIVTFIMVAFLFARSPQRADERSITLCSLVGIGISMSLLLTGIAVRNAALIMAGSCLKGIAAVWFYLMVGTALCTMRSRTCMTCIAVAYVVSYLLRFVLTGMDATVAIIAFCVAQCVALLLALPYGRQAVAAAQQGIAPIDGSVTHPDSFLPFSHKLFIAILVFRFAYGFALTFGAVESNPQQALFGIVPLAILLVMLVLPRLPRADLLSVAAALLIIAGFLAVTVWGTAQLYWSNGLMYAGTECFEMLVWFVLACIGNRNPAQAVSMFAWARAAASAGLLLGALSGHAVNTFAYADNAVALVAACVVLVFVGINLTLLKDFSFQRTIDGVSPMIPLVVAPAGMVPDERRCEAVSECFGLTPRETEILELLSHGRNGPFIQEKLVLSRNTVKTHVSNIYAKLGVHSQQELIDLVEDAARWDTFGVSGKARTPHACYNERDR